MGGLKFIHVSKKGPQELMKCVRYIRILRIQSTVPFNTVTQVYVIIASHSLSHGLHIMWPNSNANGMIPSILAMYMSFIYSTYVPPYQWHKTLFESSAKRPWAITYHVPRQFLLSGIYDHHTMLSFVHCYRLIVCSWWILPLKYKLDSVLLGIHG